MKKKILSVPRIGCMCFCFRMLRGKPRCSIGGNCFLRIISWTWLRYRKKLWIPIVGSHRLKNKDQVQTITLILKIAQIKLTKITKTQTLMIITTNPQTPTITPTIIPTMTPTIIPPSHPHPLSANQPSPPKSRNNKWSSTTYLQVSSSPSLISTSSRSTSSSSLFIRDCWIVIIVRRGDIHWCWSGWGLSIRSIRVWWLILQQMCRPIMW